MTNENELDTPIEEIETPEVEPETESYEEVADDGPTLEDYNKVIEEREALLKEKKTLLAQKEHWRKKAEPKEETPKEEVIINNDYLTREEAILLTKGYDEQDISRLNALAKAEGKKISEMIDDEMFVAWKEKKDSKSKSEKASLKPSGISKTFSEVQKPNMTKEEHQKMVEKMMNG
jgi:hypothetical protein